MIRESLYFSFAGRRSTEFGIYNVNTEGGLLSEQIVAPRTINEVSVRNNPKPYFIDTTKEPKKISLNFSLLEEKMTDELENEIIRWLDVDFYQPLFFSENIDRVFYAMPVEGMDFIHNCIRQGYITLTMRCDSPFGYSHDITTPWYEFIKGNPTYKDTLEIENRGHHSFKPEIWIQKVGDGNITIHNLSNGLKKTKLANLKDGEEVYIDCEHKIIESSLPNIWRYDDFNDEYLEIVYGKNLLKIDGQAKIKFKYRYIFS